MVKKMRFCFSCGEPLGEYADHDPLDHCGAPECAREAQNEMRAMREDAHERVDREFDER